MGQLVVIRRDEDRIEQDTQRERLLRAIKERDSFLEKHPHLKEFQKEIDRRMRGAGSFENRMAILMMMIDGKMAELRENLEELSTELVHFQEAVEQKGRPRLLLVKK